MAVFNYGTGSNSAITLSISGYFANLIWTGTGTNASGSETWDQNDTSNLSWTSSQHPNSDYFAALDNVTFDATSTPGNQTVNLSGTLQPSSVLVTGAKSYIFAGFGQITGATVLTVAGPGSLTIQNGNDSYTGGTNIQGGSIILGVSERFVDCRHGDFWRGGEQRHARSGRQQPDGGRSGRRGRGQLPRSRSSPTAPDRRH